MCDVCGCGQGEARIEGRVVGRREGQFVDDHAGQRLTTHVHALPEARGAEQHGARCRGEAAQQLRPRRLALDQQRELRPVTQQLGRASQGMGPNSPKRLVSKARGLNSPSKRRQPVGGCLWYMWVAGPKNPSLPSSRS